MLTKNTKNKKIFLIVLILLFFCLFSFLVAKFVFQKVEENIINADRITFLQKTADYFEDYKNYYKVYSGYLDANFDFLNFKNDIYADTRYNKPPVYLPKDEKINVVENSDCKTSDKKSWDLVYQVSPDGSTYNLRACLLNGTLSENYSKFPYEIVTPKSDSEKRDQQRLAIVREFMALIKDSSNYYNKFINYQFNNNSIYDEYAQYEPSFHGIGISVKLPGFSKFVTHGNCGTTTQSTWNIVYEVSQDGNSYDLAACLESGGESKNFSAKPINKF